jgi:hypothetical protein
MYRSESDLFKYLALVLLFCAGPNSAAAAKACSSVFSVQDPDSVFCLHIRGKLSNPEKIGEFKVQLWDGCKPTDSVIVVKEMKFDFYLRRNAWYGLRIVKEGYVPSLVSINTSFPDDIEDLCEFSFVTTLVSEREADKLNRDALDFPIAILYFDPLTESFIHNKQYTSSIKSEIFNGYDLGDRSHRHRRTRSMARELKKVF